MYKKLIILLIVLIGIFLTYKIASLKKPTDTTSVEKIRMVVSSSAPQLSALIYIAQAKGYFINNHLQIITTVEPNSTVSRHEVSEGAQDIGTTSDFGFVTDSFTLKNLRILSVISNTRLIEIIGRKDKGIENPKDVKGKKIALSPQSYGAFFFGVFLTYNTLKLSDVTLVPTDLNKIPDTLTSGAVDGAVTNDPFAYTIKQKLGNNAVVLPSQFGRNNNLLLISSEKTIQAKPDAIERFMVALFTAERFIASNPQESKEIIMQQFSLDPKYLNQTWPKNIFELSLDQSLLLSMEDEARWLTDTHLAKQNQIPNYLDFIYFDALEKVKPDGVSIVR